MGNTMSKVLKFHTIKLCEKKFRICYFCDKKKEENHICASNFPTCYNCKGTHTASSYLCPEKKLSRERNEVFRNLVKEQLSQSFNEVKKETKSKLRKETIKDHSP